MHLPSGDAYLLSKLGYLGAGLGQCHHFHSSTSCSFSLAARELCLSEAGPEARLSLFLWMPLNADLLRTSSRAINETNLCVNYSNHSLLFQVVAAKGREAFNKKKKY